MNLEDRIDSLSATWSLTKKKMFAGFGYLANGNLAFGTHKKDEMILRVSEQQQNELLKKDGIRIFDMTGRPMKNWLVVSPEAYKTDQELVELLRVGYEFASSLPPK